MGLDLDGLDLEENDDDGTEEEEEEEEEDVLGFWYALVWLAIITIFISFLRYSKLHTHTLYIHPSILTYIHTYIHTYIRLHWCG